MTERCDRVSDSPDDTVEEALTDHHLDEVAEMIEQAEADAQSFESPLCDSATEPVSGPQRSSRSLPGTGSRELFSFST